MDVGAVVVDADGAVEVDRADRDLGRGRRIDVVVRNRGRDAVALDRVRIAIAARPERVLEHGWQSWSVVRRCPPDDVRPERADLPVWLRELHVADARAAGRVVAGDQVLAWDGGVVGWLGGASHLGTVEATRAGLTAVALLDGVPLAPGEERVLEPLWMAAGDPGPLLSEHASHWGELAGARTGGPAPLGWCSWYQYFSAVTPEDVRANLARAARHGVEVVQIDDGWQGAVGDWLRAAAPWGGGAASVAREIAAAGLEAGLWTAPFVAAEPSVVLAEHPDWAVVHDTGSALRATWSEHWGGWTYALDTTRPDVLDHLRATFAALRDDGFTYHKIDFCYAAAMTGRRHDGTRTRAEALRAGLEAVREGIGDDAFLVGCGCPFGPAVGVVDAMRVSADVAPVWEPAATVPGFPESAPAAANAIRASVLRAPLHRRLWVNDPDCVLLRTTDTSLTAAQRRELADVVAGAGGFAVLSDDLALYGDDEWRAVDALRAAPSDDPLDIVDPFATTVTVVQPSHRLEVALDE